MPIAFVVSFHNAKMQFYAQTNNHVGARDPGEQNPHYPTGSQHHNRILDYHLVRRRLSLSSSLFDDTLISIGFDTEKNQTGTEVNPSVLLFSKENTEAFAMDLCARMHTRFLATDWAQKKKERESAESSTCMFNDARAHHQPEPKPKQDPRRLARNDPYKSVFNLNFSVVQSLAGKHTHACEFRYKQTLFYCCASRFPLAHSHCARTKSINFNQTLFLSNRDLAGKQSI